MGLGILIAYIVSAVAGLVTAFSRLSTGLILDRVYDDAYYVILVMDGIRQPERKVYVLKGTKSFQNTERYARFLRKTKQLCFRLSPKRMVNVRDGMPYICYGVGLMKPSKIKEEFHVVPECCEIFNLPFSGDMAVTVWNTLLCS